MTPSAGGRCGRVTRGVGAVPDRVELGLSPVAVAAAKQGLIGVVNGPAGTGKELHRNDMVTGREPADDGRPFGRVQEVGCHHDPAPAAGGPLDVAKRGSQIGSGRGRLLPAG